MQKITHRWNRLCRLGRLSGLIPLVLVVGCSLDDILAVDIPGRVEEEALQDPGLAGTLVAGVVADLECAWNAYTAAASHHSDEWIPTSGNLNLRDWGQRRKTADNINGSCRTAYGQFQGLQTARFQSDDIFSRLEAFDAADVPDKASMQGTVRAYGGFALIGLAEGFCEMTIDGGPLMTKNEVLSLAETKFTDALNLTTESDIMNMSLVGRARARLGMEDFAGAIADAEQVPAGFAQMVSRGNTEFQRYNYNFEELNNPDDPTSKHGSIASNYWDLTVDAQGNPTQNSGTADPRVIILTRGELGFDFVSIHYYHDKYISRADPIPLATYKEAQLFIAEASARSGDLTRARQTINDRHGLAGLPAFDAGATATQDEMITHVIEERRRELFQEGAQRFNDMLRFRGTQFEIPFLGEFGSIHPNGRDQTDQEYGELTCFPLPTVERNGNPNVP